tara:strand:- start:80 stop:301 length:222 start_codon:yes stop_codon:yes gene_type:complete
MGLKAPKVPVPKVDPEIAERERLAEEKLEAEKNRTLSIASKGRRSTLLTSGQGVTEEARTAKTILGGSGMGYG